MFCLVKNVAKIQQFQLFFINYKKYMRKNLKNDIFAQFIKLNTNKNKGKT